MRSCHCHNKQRIATGSSGKITWSHRLIHPSIQHWSSPSYRFDKRGLSDWCHSHTRSDNVCIYIVGWLYFSVAYYIWILQSVLPNHTCSLYLLLVTTWPHEHSYRHPPSTNPPLSSRWVGHRLLCVYREIRYLRLLTHCSRGSYAPTQDTFKTAAPIGDIILNADNSRQQQHE